VIAEQSLEESLLVLTCVCDRRRDMENALIARGVDEARAYDLVDEYEEDVRSNSTRSENDDFDMRGFFADDKKRNRS